MVGRAKLYQRTGSPLIHGRLKRAPFPWLRATGLALLAALAVWLYFRYLR